jgi:hypothetical protein
MIEAYAAGYPIRITTYGQPSSPPGDQVVGATGPMKLLTVNFVCRLFRHRFIYAIP